MRFRSTLGALLCAAAIVSGCSTDQLTDPPLNVEDPTTSALTGSEMQSVVRAFALAMRDESVRIAVRDAMRASPFSKHKLILQEFIATPSGSRMLGEASRASGIERDVLQRIIVGLPEMDFFVPFRQQRLTWRGEGDVAVVGSWYDASSLSGFTDSGKRISYSPAEREPAHTVFVLRPSESRAIRLDRQANVRGDVIQELTDGDLAAEAFVVGLYGRTIRVDPRDPRSVRAAIRGTSPDSAQTMDECGPSSITCEDPGGPGQAYQYTWLERYEVNWRDPNPEDWDLGSMEIEFRSRLYNSTGVALTGEYVLRLTDVEEYVEYVPQTVLASFVPSSARGEAIKVEIVETDFMSSGQPFTPGWLYGGSHNHWTTFVMPDTDYADPGDLRALICYGGASNPCPQ